MTTKQKIYASIRTNPLVWVTEQGHNVAGAAISGPRRPDVARSYEQVCGTPEAVRAEIASRWPGGWWHEGHWRVSDVDGRQVSVATVNVTVVTPELFKGRELAA